MARGTGGTGAPPAERLGTRRVESACKPLVNRRLKSAGMRWTVGGANAVLAIGSARDSGWFDDYWEDRLYSMAA